ncbi:MAG: hypothetical protein IH872_12100 [Chloroflexi bacterium]|nr:hypothetical protein [Chloroflexota bacterium]
MEESSGEAEDKLREMVRNLRQDPEHYRSLRQRFLAASSDEDRVKLLVDFATTESEFREMVPTELGREALATITTVTVTTVTWPETAY